MSDLKMNFDELNKACKEVNETWREMMNENNPFDTISKIAKDIRDREDRELALAFTNVVGSLLRENGVFVKTSRYEFETHNETHNETDKNEYIIKKEYGVSFDGLDFTEHDKRFKDEIADLRKELRESKAHITQLEHELEKTYNQLMEVEKDAQERIAELESELEVKDNLLKIKNGLCKNELPTEITIDGYKCEIIQTEQGLYISRDRIYEIIDKEKKVLKDKCTELEDRHKEDCDKINQLKHELSKKVVFETDRLVKLPFDALETANMLINATYKRENCMTGIEYDKDIYSIDDLEQIAEHLLVYCKHHREDDD